MREFCRIIMLNSYLALACGGMAMAIGCGAAGQEHADSASVALEIRFQDSDEARQQSSSDVLRFAAAATSKTTFDDVARILVDISFADTGQPFFTNFELTEFAPDEWRADVPALPRNQHLRFLPAH
jgi:hypothetical protein